MCRLPLAAAAVTAPRAPLRLLGRGLAAAMSAARPLKSVDYEVFGRVQGRGPPYSGRPKWCWGGRLESCDKHSPSLGGPAPLWLGLPPGHDTARTGGKETKGACAGELGWAGEESVDSLGRKAGRRNSRALGVGHLRGCKGAGSRRQPEVGEEKRRVLELVIPVTCH